MATRIVRNGQEGHSEVHWGPLIKWTAGILSALVVSASIGIFLLLMEIPVIKHEITELQTQTDNLERKLDVINDRKLDKSSFDKHDHHGVVVAPGTPRSNGFYDENYRTPGR